jgi:hypothetical protein
LSRRTPWQFSRQPNTLWRGANAVSLADLPESASEAILVVEIVGSNIHWMEPRDLNLATLSPNGRSSLGLQVGSPHLERFRYVAADTATWALDGNISLEKIRELAVVRHEK